MLVVKIKYFDTLMYCIDNVFETWEGWSKWLVSLEWAAGRERKGWGYWEIRNLVHWYEPAPDISCCCFW